MRVLQLSQIKHLPLSPAILIQSFPQGDTGHTGKQDSAQVVLI
jgi:hypothetical protein